jgi:hypothetical protein
MVCMPRNVEKPEGSAKVWRTTMVGNEGVYELKEWIK